VGAGAFGEALGRFGGAGLEGLGQPFFFELAADEDQAAAARFAGPPGALPVAFQQHVHRLEHQAPIVARHVDDALCAQDVGALLGYQPAQPLADPRLVHGPV